MKSLPDIEYYIDITRINSREDRRILCILIIYELTNNVRRRNESLFENKLCRMYSNTCTEHEMHFMFGQLLLTYELFTFLSIKICRML